MSSEQQRDLRCFVGACRFIFNKVLQHFPLLNRFNRHEARLAARNGR
ncbi:hypothetical protein DIE19_31395 [Burkholderia sp. Bp9126]|nr:hypothetical protein DIE19_31395 [Burkholderia sp. Bp9126]